MTAPALTKNDSYLKQRLQALGITTQQNIFERVWMNKASKRNDDTGKIETHDHEERRNYNIFDVDDDGNIIIRYFDLTGQPFRWKKEDTKQTRDFIRKRLREPKGDYKYHQDSGSPLFPFFNPSIIQKYKWAKEGDDRGTIETLILTEGEFKAFKGAMCGMDIVGLPGIHGFYNGDVKGKLNEDIQELIITCRVKKIVFLFDADLLTLKWTEEKDLSKRPYNFYGSIKAFRESLQLLLDEENEKVPLSHVYLMHIKTKYLNEAKGLDDLLCKYDDRSVEIQEDLYSLNFAKKYFEGMSILDQNKDVHNRVFKYLGLTDEQEFYKTYQEFIGAREFKFKRRRYVYNQEAKEVVFVRHEDADKFMRIGPDWVKVITKVNKYNESEEEIVPWKISEIQRDYKKFPDFLDQVQKYDDFCNEPNWSAAYKRVINGCYNICHPLTWTPEDGPIAETVQFLKHIFQGQGTVLLDSQGYFEKEVNILGDPFTVALDYLTLLIKHPKHMLPVPILVSPENGTGKSTFLKWEQAIFKSNMCILGNEQFKMKFNGHYITKYIIAIDEGFLEVDKKSEKERLKQLVTADSAFLENKGMNVRKINYYGKLQISSNDADRVMKIDEGESRWFVVRVPVATKKDPDLELKLRTEIPAFLKFLYNRQIFHPREDRLWFKPEYFITDQFRLIVDTTKNRIDRVFENWIKEQFLQFKQTVLRYTTSYLIQVFNDPKNSKYKIDELDLKSYLNSKGLKPEKESIYHKSPKGFKEVIYTEGSGAEPIDQTPAIIWWSGSGRPFTFRCEDWLTEEEVRMITGIETTEPKPASNDDLPF